MNAMPPRGDSRMTRNNEQLDAQLKDQDTVHPDGRVQDATQCAAGGGTENICHEEEGGGTPD